MIKILSLFLSFTILFSSLAPSYAQGLSDLNRTKMRISLSSDYTMPNDNTRVERRNFAVSLERANLKAQKEVGTLALEVRSVLDSLTNGKDTDLYKEFSKLYRQEMEKVLKEVLAQAQSQEEKDLINKTYKQLVSEKEIKKVYEKEGKVVEEEAVKEGEKYIKDLSRRIYQVGQKNPAGVLSLVEEAYPVFASMGALDKDVKTWGASLVRKEVEQYKNSCAAPGFLSSLKGQTEQKQKECERALKAVSALAVLGQEGNNADTQAVADLLRVGQDGIMAPSVIMLAGTALFAMKGDDKLVGEIHAVSQKLPDVGLIGKDMSFLSLQDWVKASKVVWEQGDWAIGQESSFYKGEGQALENAWTNLGQYLGEISASKDEDAARARAILDRLTAQSVIADRWGNIRVEFPIFVSGALAGGYKLQNQGYRGYQLGYDGKSSYVDNTANWAEVEKRTKELKINLTGYAAVRMYFSGKADLDPYTRLAVNNMLVNAYTKSGNRTKFSGMEKRNSPSAGELQSSRNWETAMNTAFGVDVVLVAVGVVSLGVSLVKASVAGVRGLSRLAKVLKVARAGAKGGVRSFAQSYKRVMRLGLARKYGVSSWKEVYITRLAEVNGVQAVKLQAPVKELRASRAAAAATTTNKISPETVSATAEQWMATTREIEAQKLAQTAQWQAAQDARAAAAATTNGASKPLVTGADIPGVDAAREAAYIQVPMKNALGQEVMGWRPRVLPEVGPKPSLAKSWWNRSTELFGDFKYETQEIFSGLKTAFRNKVASVALSTSLAVTPFPSTSVNTFLQLGKEANALVRTEQVVKGTNGLLVKDFSTMGKGWTLPAADAPVLSLNKASMLPVNLGTTAGTSAPWSANLSWMGFMPAAVTPDDWRRLGAPRFFENKSGTPQFIKDYVKQSDQYSLALAQWGDAAALEKITRMTPEQWQEVRTEQQKAWERFFPNGAFSVKTFSDVLNKRLLGNSVVLSMNGFGYAVEKLNTSRIIKKAASLVNGVYQAAVLEANKTGASLQKLFAEKLSIELAAAFPGTSASVRGEILNMFALPTDEMSSGRISNPLSTEEIFGVQDDFTPQAGFRLTYVEEKDGPEKTLPVALLLDPRIKSDGYDRITFSENAHAQLRNGTQDPKTMSHFFFKFMGTPQQWKEFVGLVQQANLPSPFHIKLQRRPNIAVKTVTVPLYTANGMEKLPIEVELEKKLLPEEGSRVVLREDGQIGVLRPFTRESEPITDRYIRLPKHQIANMVQVLKNSSTVFPIAVLPTKNKAAILYRNQQIYNNSLGKTMGPIIHTDLGISSASATSLMMVINYVIPGLASFLNPILRRMGEKRLSVIAGFMTSLSNFLPPLVGFYGLAHDQKASTIAASVIITAFILRSAASVLQQVTSNMLVAANNGRISQKKKQSSQVGTSQEKVTFKELVSRIKEVWKKSDSSEDIRNLLMYNLSFVYKNLGTLLFLALPWLINKGIYAVTGVDAHLVYSISFPVFGLYALFVTIQTLRANLRDAYTAPTVDDATQKAHASAAEAAANLEKTLSERDHTQQEMADLLEGIAKKFQEKASAVEEAYRNEGTKRKDLPGIRKDLLASLEREFSAALAKHLPAEESAKIAQDFAATLQHLEQNPVSPWQVFLHAPSVALITLGMTLATVHEFTISSAFAMNLNKLIPDGDMANLLVAVSLYVPLILGRLGGNLMASRISSGTMYLICSGLSALGTVVMLGAGGNVAASIIGAVITSLGVGNYFSQMYDYVTKKNPKLQREISVILAVTMALAGGLTVPASHLNEWFNGTNLDIWYALGALIASLSMTTGMMKNSTIVKFIKSSLQDLKKSLKKDKKDNSNNNDQAPTDLGEPLAN